MVILKVYSGGCVALLFVVTVVQLNIWEEVEFLASKVMTFCFDQKKKEIKYLYFHFLGHFPLNRYE